jgi:hypothetical protein
MSNKIREALERSTTRLKGVADCYPEIRHLMQSQIEENDAALSEPLRNCDVGTAEEQTVRFDEFCRKNSDRNCLCLQTCPCKMYDEGLESKCEIYWSQLPYKEVTK